MKEKLWPAIVRVIRVKKTSTKTLIENIREEISKNFVTEAVIQNTNEISKQAAAALWHPLGRNEITTREESDQANIQSYNNLMETLSSLLRCTTLQVLCIY